MSAHPGRFLTLRNAGQRPLVFALAIAAVMAACSGNQESITAFRERQETVLPMRAKLSERLDTVVDVELKADDVLMLRWYLRAQSITVDHISSGLRTILATLRSNGLKFRRVVIEAVFASHSPRTQGEKAVRATFSREAVDAEDWDAGAGDPFVAAEELVLHAKTGARRSATSR